jgi:hypothetical protein
MSQERTERAERAERAEKTKRAVRAERAVREGGICGVERTHHSAAGGV